MARDSSVAVVVLGDLGRSPRMQYHTLSLVEQAGKEVHVVAYGGTQPHASLVHNSRVHLHALPTLVDFVGGLVPLERLPKPLVMIVKALFQVFVLLYALLVRVPGVGFVLLQTPPCIPTFAVCKLACLLKRSELVIDWHNFGYTLLALNLSQDHPLVSIAESYERLLGKLGDYHLCVTRAMRKELETNWGVMKAQVLYDRPPQFFQPLSYSELHSLFVKLSKDFAEPMHVRDCCCTDNGGANGSLSTRSASARTLFTEKQREASGGTSIVQVADRPALVVSSTSWTPDEDFGILLEAAKLYDELTHDLKSYPRLLFVITGKGPMKEAYRKKMASMEFKKVAFRLMWLSAEDYPRLVSAADLGVSLHISSSGFDLPMKVVDMFGCGVPVCSANYSCVEELVQNNRNGMLFNDAEELAQQLKALFHNFGREKNSRLQKLKAGAMASSKRRWTDEWAKVGLGIFAGGKGKDE
ncbi:glycosyltransferase [Chloropicon primus]|nr:glycosyltransferase [Chloropicon primus]|mmetsp:Transcript_17838/g.36616  ORF Transcript_17838/g.36616 Transcript_17838/m.36616 type:complete len:469 (+) Transcript_17838:331-1737(+)